MCRDLSRWRQIGVEQPRGEAMCGIVLRAIQRRLNGVANNWVDETRRVVRVQQLETDEARSQGLASAISKPAIADAWRSSQPSPSTASAWARPSARGPSARTRASTRRATPPRPRASSAAGSSAASGRSSSSTARNNSVRYRGLPPLAAHAVAQSARRGPSP